MTRLYVALQARLAELKEQRDDRGASMLEYGAVLVLVAAIAAIVIAAGDGIGETIRDGMKGAISDVFSSSG